MPIYQGDVGVTIKCSVDAPINLENAEITVTVVKPSATLLKRKGIIEKNRIIWNSGYDLDEAGIYKISFEIKTSIAVHCTSHTFIVRELIRDKVFLDKEHGIPGTVWPVGTASIPVNNMEDAQTIAKNNAIKIIHDMTFGTDWFTDEFCQEATAVVCPEMKELAKRFEKELEEV